MFCPQCGTESSQDLKFCRSCGANLKVIGKAVTLSEAIARSDGIPAKLKDIFSNIKIAHVTEDVSRALDRMNKEIARSTDGSTSRKLSWLEARKKTPQQRRERYVTKGLIKFFGGGGLTIFLYYLAHALVLKLPPDVTARVPFEIDPVVRVLWLVGLIPVLSGMGHIIAGLTIRSAPAKEIEFPEQPPLRIDPEPSNARYENEMSVATARETPASVTDRTTNILNHAPPPSGANGKTE